MAIAPHTQEMQKLKREFDTLVSAGALPDDDTGLDYFLKQRNVDSELFRQAKEDESKIKKPIEEKTFTATPEGNIQSTEPFLPQLIKQAPETIVYGLGKVADIATNIGGDILETFAASQSQVAALEQLQGQLYAAEINQKDKETADELVNNALDLRKHTDAGEDVRNVAARIRQDIQKQIIKTDIGKDVINTIALMVDPEQEVVYEQDEEGNIIRDDKGKPVTSYKPAGINEAIDMAIETAPLFVLGSKYAKAAQGKGILSNVWAATKLAFVENALTSPESETLAPDVGQLIGLMASEYGVPIEPGDAGVFAALALNPDDPALIRRAKQMVDSLAIAGALTGVFKIPGVANRFKNFTADQLQQAYQTPEGKQQIIAGLTAAAAISYVPLMRDKEAVDKNLLDIPEDTEDSVFVPTYIKDINNKPAMQAGLIVDVVSPVFDGLKTLNQKLGRALNSKAGLSEPMFKRFLNMKQGMGALENTLNNEINTLQKLQADNDIPDSLVNAFFTGQLSKDEALTLMPRELVENITQLRTNIDNNTDEIASLLNLDPKSKLGITFQEGKGAYFTTTYQAYSNPQWNKNLTKALKGKRDPKTGDLLVDPNKPNSVKTAKIINEARSWLKSLPGNKQFDDSQIDAMLEDILNKGNKDNILDSIVDMIEGKFGVEAAKVLKEKKKLDEPLVQLLGRIDNPAQKYAETIRSQQNVILKARYLKEISDLANATTGTKQIISDYNIPPEIASKLLNGVKVDKLYPEELADIPPEAIELLRQPPKTVPIDGFFPGLKKRGEILRQAEGGATNNLGQLEQKLLGNLGAEGSPMGLDQFVVSDELFKMFDTGIDTFENAAIAKVPTWIRRLSGYTQATETIYDPNAYFTNLYGMFQAVAGNGHIFNPKLMQKAGEGGSMLLQRIKQNDPKALRTLKRLQENGVLDTSLTQRIIEDNLDLVDKELGGLAASEGFLGLSNKLTNYTKDKLKKGVKIPSKLYGVTDDWGKITSYMMELDSYRSALKPFDGIIDDFDVPPTIAKKLRNGIDLDEKDLKELSPEVIEMIDVAQEEIENYAMEVVRNTMPSYTSASPVVRNVLSRIPLGTYATFPAEVLRTQFNSALTGFKDLARGTAEANPQLIRTGARRLAGIAGTAAAIEYGTRANNDAVGQTETNERAIRLLGPDFFASSEQFHATPLMVDKDGTWMADYNVMASYDANQNIKGSLRPLIARALNGDKVTEREIQDATMNALFNTFGSFISTKQYVDTIRKVGFNTDKYGNTFYDGVNFEEDLSKAAYELMSLASPAALDDAFRISEAYEAEKLAEQEGKTIARSSKGYPVDFMDAVLRFAGDKSVKLDITKAVGSYIYKETSEMDELSKNLLTYFKDLPSSVKTPEELEEIKEKINLNISEREKKQNRFYDGIQIIKNMSGVREIKGKPTAVTFGTDGLARALQTPERLKYNVSPKKIGELEVNFLPGLLPATTQGQQLYVGYRNMLINEKGLPQEFVDSFIRSLFEPKLLETKRRGQFDRLNVEPVYQTDEEGNVVVDAEGNPIEKEIGITGQVLKNVFGYDVDRRYSTTKVDYTGRPLPEEKQ
jgi:hypothetical protein